MKQHGSSIKGAGIINTNYQKRKEKKCQINTDYMFLNIFTDSKYLLSKNHRKREKTWLCTDLYRWARGHSEGTSFCVTTTLWES